MFDPSELTVKKARARLSDLDLEGLEGVLAAEINGKHRSSLIAEIGRSIDALKTAEGASAEEVSVEEPEPTPQPVRSPVVVLPAKRRITKTEWFRLSRFSRKAFRILPGGDFEEI